MRRLSKLPRAWIVAALCCVAAAGAGCRAPYDDVPELPWSALSIGLSKELIAEAYDFARTHETILREVPCYCGCQRNGHGAVLDCFVLGRDRKGRVIWSDHAMGCQVCVDVVRDALTMSRQGLSPTEIRTATDKKYLPVFGTSTHEPHRRRP